MKPLRFYISLPHQNISSFLMFYLDCNFNNIIIHSIEKLTFVSNFMHVPINNWLSRRYKRGTVAALYFQSNACESEIVCLCLFISTPLTLYQTFYLSLFLGCRSQLCDCTNNTVPLSRIENFSAKFCWFLKGGPLLK